MNNDILARLNPKLAKQFKMAQDIENIRYPVASRRLTEALGGGIGAGRITLLYGGFSSGKSMLSLQTVANLQKQGLTCAWADVEGAFDPAFSARLGVDNSELIVTGAKSAETLANQLSALVEAEIDLIVVDSISAVMPGGFVEKDGMLKGAESRIQIGAQAKAIKSIIDSLLFNNTKTAVILISQLTTKMETYGARAVPHGGNSPMFASSQVIRLSSSNTNDNAIKQAEQLGTKIVQKSIGRPVDAVVEKNKLGPQSRTARYDIYYDGDFVGVDQIGELVDMCIERGIIEQSGAWYTLEEERVHGRGGVIDRVRSDESLQEILDKKIGEAIAGQKK